MPDKAESERKVPMVNKYEIERIANQKSVHAIVTLLGNNKWSVKNLMEHIGADEEKFDPDANCGAISCRHCGACSGDGMDWLEFEPINDKSIGGQMFEMEDEDDPDHSIMKLYWNITCRVCGENWKQYLREV